MSKQTGDSEIFGIEILHFTFSHLERGGDTSGGLGRDHAIFHGNRLVLGVPNAVDGEDFNLIAHDAQVLPFAFGVIYGRDGGAGGEEEGEEEKRGKGEKEMEG